MARKGCQKPTFEQFSPWAYTDSRQAAMLASEYFGKPLKWQRHVLDVLMSRTESDTYANGVVAVAVPRQNGKSWDVRARCFYGALVDGEKILYTCQHSDTADEMFKALSRPFEDDDGDPELRGMLNAVRKTNGQQAILLNNGGLIRFTTRTNSLARGKSYDVIVYDEAQELTSTQQAASLPTVSASAKHNPQIIYLCTPPSTECAGDVIVKMHEDVRKGAKPDVAWIEWAEDSVGDVLDVDRWYRANPSLGYLIDERTVAMEASAQGADDFARERLGWWAKRVGAKLIARADWDGLATADPPMDGLQCFGVKFSATGRKVSVAVALKNDGGTYVELVHDRSTARGTRWLVEWLRERRDRFAEVYIDGRSGADAFKEALEAREGYAGMPLKKGQATVVSPRQAAAAVSTLLGAVTDGSLSHFAQPALTESAVGAVKRRIGSEGAFGFGDGAVDCTPIAAASLAVLAAVKTKRKPGRKQKLQ